MRQLIPVILSGGSGTRLWPLSSDDRPKQFWALVTGHSLFQETLLRTRALGAFAAPPLVVCNQAHRFLVAEQLRVIDGAARTIVLEPEGRNTAASRGCCGSARAGNAPPTTKRCSSCCRQTT